MRLCVWGVSGHGVMMSGENNTINHRSWNISFLFFFFTRSWTVLMIRLGTHLHPGYAPHRVGNGGRAERAIDLHPPRVILIVVIKNWTMEAANRAWWFLLGSKTHKQAIIYESEQANLKSDIQVVLMCTYLVVTGKQQTFRMIQVSKNKQ